MQLGSAPVPIGIIVPVYNEAKVLSATLARLHQYQDLVQEIILVDGGSSDETVAIAESYVRDLSKIKIITSAKGRAAQMNAGAQATQSQILLFLHADTQLPDDFAEELVRFEGASQEWGRFDVMLSEEGFAFKMVAWFMNHRSRLTGIATGDQAIFAKRALFNSLGGFPAQPLMEDIEFSKRAKYVSRPFCSRKRVITDARRWLKHGVTKTILLMWSLRIRYFLGADPEILHRRYYSN